MGRATIKAIVLPYGIKCQKCGKDNHIKAMCASLAVQTKEIQANIDPKVKGKFHEIS